MKVSVINKKVSIPKASGSDDKIIDALILEMKDVVGNQIFQMVSDKTVLQMTKLLKDDLSDFRVKQDWFLFRKIALF
jgi:hypothetical protein